MSTIKPLLSVEALSCQIDGKAIVENLDFHLEEGQLGALLGASGCGKTTILRSIAGFQPVHRGEIRLRDSVLANASQCLPPEQRRVGLVFQDYALFPHLDVAGNIGFGLRHLNAADGQRKVERLLQLIQLPGFGSRFPHELSGGQQQRVALARALAPEPDLLLLDEPFSNLDVDLRASLNRDIRKLLKDLGMCAILVTHDQEEAFTFADKIGFIGDGILHQWGSASELYDKPKSIQVAEFIGNGRLLPAVVAAEGLIDTELGAVKARHLRWSQGTSVKLLLRAEDLVIDHDQGVPVRIVDKHFRGGHFFYSVDTIAGNTVDIVLPRTEDHALGNSIPVRPVCAEVIAFT